MNVKHADEVAFDESEFRGDVVGEISIRYATPAVYSTVLRLELKLYISINVILTALPNTGVNDNGN